jgi:hypothetical protein
MSLPASYILLANKRKAGVISRQAFNIYKILQRK